MSEIRVENIIGETGTDAVKFTKGISVTGIVTATNVSIGSSVTASTFHGSGAALTGINPGITNAQQFRLAANQSGSETTGTVFTNWQAVMTTYEAIGSNWSQSSGIFSCSATGIYLCMWTMVISNTSTGDAFDPNIQISTNSGSSYTTRSRSWGHVQNSSTARDSPSAQFMFDVTDTSTFRLRFRQSQTNDIASGTTIAGSTSENLTNIMFIRLGDT
tara:strand:- start:732 stop:1382 length:651 start_codon:yes stop_codon:yes gene_type:complete